MTRPALTPPQIAVLALAAQHDDIAGSNHTGPTQPCINETVAGRLADRGLLTRTGWNGRTWTYRITDAGREALDQ